MNIAPDRTFLVTFSGKEVCVKSPDFTTTASFLTLNPSEHVVFTPDSKYIVTDRPVAFWDTKGTCITTFPAGSNGSPSFSPKGDYMAFADSTACVYLVNIKERKIIQKFSQAGSDVYFTSDTQISGVYRNCVKVYDIETGKVVRKYGVPEDHIRDMSADRKKIVTTDYKKAYVYGIDTGKPVLQASFPVRNWCLLYFSPSAQRVLVQETNNLIDYTQFRVHTIPDGREIFDFQLPGRWQYAAFWSDTEICTKGKRLSLPE